MLLQNMGHVSAKQHSAQCVAFHPQTQRRVRCISAVYKASRVQSPKWKGCSRLQSGLICASASPENGSASTSDAESVLDCVIVGGGISGLCTALAFKAEHGSTVKKFLLTEGRERVGGNITTVSNDEGYLWEEGPNSFQPSDAVLKAAVSPPCYNFPLPTSMLKLAEMQFFTYIVPNFLGAPNNVAKFSASICPAYPFCLFATPSSSLYWTLICPPALALSFCFFEMQWAVIAGLNFSKFLYASTDQCMDSHRNFP